MPIGTGTAIALGAISAGGSLASAAIGSHAAGKAAETQTKGALTAAEMERQSAKEALDFEKEMFGYQKGIQAPWIQAGTGALNTLTQLMDPGHSYPGGVRPDGTRVPPGTTAPGELAQPFVWDESKDPGYQFRLSEGLKALERSASARGNLLSGGTGKALERYGQDYASGEYENSFQRFRQSQADKFNRYAALAGIGQLATGQASNAASNTAGDVSNILMGSSRDIGNTIQNAAAARASGYMGGANAWGGAMGNIASLPTDMLLLSSLLKKG